MANAVKPYWESETHGLRIYHGDCLEVMPALGEEFDLCLTDPPYNIGRNGIPNDSLGEHFVPWLAAVCTLLPTKCLLLFAYPTQLDKAIDAVRDGGWRFRRTLTNYAPGKCSHPLQRWLLTSEAIIVAERAGANWEGEEYGHDTIWRSSAWIGRQLEMGWHPSVKDLPVIAGLLRQATLMGQSVIDPFLGSGTTLVAAYRLGRRGVGIEISEEYCELAARRLEQEIAQGRLFEPAELDSPRQEALW